MQSITLKRISSIFERRQRVFWWKKIINDFQVLDIIRHQSQTHNDHIPVLCEKSIEFLDPGPNKTIIDMTFGSGGHSRRILEQFENVKIIAVDRDPVAIQHAVNLKKSYPDQIVPVLSKFSDLPFYLKEINIEKVDGVIFDFGCSSMQFDNAERGFSVSQNGPLDMRMNNTDSDQITATDVLAKIDENDLAKIIRIYGEEKFAKKIARAIIEARSMLIKIDTTKKLANIVNACLNEHQRFDKLQRPAHLATKTFQALRIFVNNELNEINFGMILSHKILREKGRLVTLTFHSLEDTIVKRHINGNVIEGLANPLPLKYVNHSYLHDKNIVESLSTSNWSQINKHVIVPDDTEISLNPRSRSAKLRAALKL